MSLRKAINDKCRDCIYDSLARGTWRQQVEGCTIKSCSLWPHRPMSTAGKSSPQDASELATNQEAA
jgi:hypothetical protein